MKLQWLFPPHQPGYIKQDPIQRGFFTVDSIGGLDQALVREAIQNALDARLSSKQPVRIRFARVEVPSEAYGIYVSGLKPHVDIVQDGTITIPNFNESMSFLVIEDFSTTGLLGDADREDIDSNETDQNFYYFWRNVGRTGKKADNRGRWGLGKTVFPATSKFSTFFGLTCRAADGKRLLMGQSILKYHDLGAETHTPYGYYGLFDEKKDRYLAHPIEDEEQIEHFCSIFGLRRKHHPGLSIVIPAPSEMARLDRLLISAIYQYFYPIFVNDLELQFPKVLVNASNMREIIRRVPDQRLELDREAFLRLLDFVDWSLQVPQAEFIHLEPLRLDRAPDWKGLLTEEQMASARQHFETEGKVAFRVGMKVEMKSQGKSKRRSPELGWFQVFIERDENLSRAESHFIRNGIRIIDVKGHSLRGIRGMVVIDDPLLGRMLGDAENPAHTEWQKDTPSFQKYEHGPSSLSFVRNSLSLLAKALTEVSQVIEKDLLKDIFYLDREQDNVPTKRDDGKKKIIRESEEKTDSFPDFSSRPQPLASRRIAQGVEITSPGGDVLVDSVTIQFAYEVRKGNAFQRYHPFDFELADDKMQIESSGVIIDQREKNILRFSVIDKEFCVRVTGFDELRDVVMKMRWTEANQ